MPIRRSPNGARHVRSQPGRNRPERVVAINRNAWSQSVGTGGRNHPVRACCGNCIRPGWQCLRSPRPMVVQIILANSISLCFLAGILYFKLRGTVAPSSLR